MTKLAEYIKDIIEKSPSLIVMSGPVKGSEVIKLRIRELDGKYQAESFTQTQAFHKNLEGDDLGGYILENFSYLKRLNAFTEDEELTLRITKKDKPLFGVIKNERRVKEEGHNREKNYIIKEGTSVPALRELGIFTEDGRVVKSKFDKFIQINRFIEMIDDEVKNFEGGSISVLDFGCGKSYLTFLIYHYLKEIRGLNVEITGLDIKKDVIKKCKGLAEKYNCEGLEFIHTRIEDYEPKTPPDMLISLHACDTATDYSIYSGIKLGARYIFAVPCCQHELNKHINSNMFDILLRYGIIKERFAALLTDSIRANLLRASGYRAQVLEFVDLAHTPKNLLIRAVKSNIPQDVRDAARKEVELMMKEFNIDHTLWHLLEGEENGH